MAMPAFDRYVHHRNSIALLLYTVLCLWHCAGTTAYRQVADSGAGDAPWRRMLAGAESAWVLLLGITLQARFTWHATAAAAALVLATIVWCNVCEPAAVTAARLLGSWSWPVQAGKVACCLLQPLFWTFSMYLVIVGEWQARASVLALALAHPGSFPATGR